MRDPSPSPEFKSPLPSAGDQPTALAAPHPDAGAGGEFQGGGFYRTRSPDSERSDDGGLWQEEWEADTPAVGPATGSVAAEGSSGFTPSSSSSTSAVTSDQEEQSSFRYDSYCARSLFLVVAMATAGMGFLYNSRNETVAAMSFWLFATGLFVATFARFEKAPLLSNTSGLLLGGAKPVSKCRSVLGYSSAVTALGAVVAAGYFSAKHQASVATALWGVVIAAAIIAQRSLDSQSKETSSPSFGYGATRIN